MMISRADHGKSINWVTIMFSQLLKDLIRWGKCHNNMIDDAPPHSLKDSNVNPKMKTMEEGRVGVRSLIHNTSKVEGCAGALGWGLR
jgi:hypothetical protein